MSGFWQMTHVTALHDLSPVWQRLMAQRSRAAFAATTTARWAAYLVSFLLFYPSSTKLDGTLKWQGPVPSAIRVWCEQDATIQVGAALDQH